MKDVLNDCVDRWNRISWLDRKRINFIRIWYKYHIGDKITFWVIMLVFFPILLQFEGYQEILIIVVTVLVLFHFYMAAFRHLRNRHHINIEEKP